MGTLSCADTAPVIAHKAQSTVATLLFAAVCLRYLPPVFQWAFSRAVLAPDLQACGAVRGVGACWGVVAEKYRLIVFGRYPYAEQ